MLAIAQLFGHPAAIRSAGWLVRVLWIAVGALAGLVIGALAGVAVMPLHPRSDGTYGMREMLICLPCGALVGLVAGIVWGCRPSLP